ncbi:serine/threonine-protein kinase [Streptomyces sp. 4N509B]|uniref:serine/threonine-protein kinase n=1 Tax=Streptomyces sp. 4N509B TaxID=3457413 RepID=UPI003FD67C40
MHGLEGTDPRRIGRYRITGRLGAGGMGRVYLGRSPSGRLVAVKVVRPELAEDPGFRRRFAREVAAARKVTGFFTAAVVDADPDGSPPWLATAYVPGLALDEAVAAHGPWPAHAVRALGAGLAEALEAVHAAGLVHRDLKPSNVLIAADGPRVVDFGISVAAEATALTRTGTVVGTPGFMAPEQLTGAPVTPATDVFALGAVLAYAATGTGPFGTGSAQALNFRIAYEEPDLGALPTAERDVVARCLAKDPAARPAVAALVEELAPAGAEEDDGQQVGGAAVTAAPWIPTAVTRAIATTVTAAAAPTPTEPVVAPVATPQPTPQPATPQPATPPTAAPAAAPAVTGESAARPGSAFSLRLAIVAIAASMALPAVYGNVALNSMAEGSLPYVLAAALSVGSCVAALVTSRPGRTRPVPRWPRYLLLTSTVVSMLLFVILAFAVLEEEGNLTPLGPGVWVYVVACAVMTYSADRFPAARRGSPR